MKKDISRIAVPILNAPKITTRNGNKVPYFRKIKIDIVGRFEYVGHHFIVHRPRTENPTGFVVSEESLGFLASQPAGMNDGMGFVINPIQYPSIEAAELATKENIDNYQIRGKSFAALILNYKPAMKKMINYIELKLKKVI